MVVWDFAPFFVCELARFAIIHVIILLGSRSLLWKNCSARDWSCETPIFFLCSSLFYLGFSVELGRQQTSAAAHVADEGGYRLVGSRRVKLGTAVVYYELWCNPTLILVGGIAKDAPSRWSLQKNCVKDIEKRRKKVTKTEIGSLNDTCFTHILWYWCVCVCVYGCVCCPVVRNSWCCKRQGCVWAHPPVHFIWYRILANTTHVAV